ncbi:MAG: TPM domain-containing protein [Acidobacteria bacterium]|nr:TPM domain-containing protein [Acidobacteriota bacterium]
MSGRALCGSILLVLLAAPAPAQELPELTAPVNDFANVIDPESKAAMDRLIRSLQSASGDVVVVAAVETIAPYADIREYAVEMFENRGRGIGQRGRDNGLLVVLAVNDRQVWIEVGYDLEQFITDGFAGETSRQVMAPEFRRGEYGRGLLLGVSRIIGRIAERRNVTLQDVPPDAVPNTPEVGSGQMLLVALFVLFLLLNAVAARTRGRRFRRRWGGPIGGWHSGVGPFGDPFGGFGRGGGFGGGFGGFGGGRSGGGGGGARW